MARFNPNPKGQPAMKRKKQHEVVLPDLDIFKKKDGVEYFNSEEWHSFPFVFSSVRDQKKKGGEGGEE